jgi:hypothetical protein
VQEEAEAQAETLVEDEQKKPVEKKVEVVDPSQAFKSKEQVGRAMLCRVTV